MKKIIANITYKSVFIGMKNIEERNEYFNSLDKQSQRLEIAWDGLQLIINGKVNAEYGGYWSDSLYSLTTKNSKEFQKKLVKQLPSCEVCQRGLIMLSQIRLGNCIEPTDHNRDCGDNANLKGFSIEDMQSMESEYEHCLYGHPYRNNTREKLANICCNILVNGNFNIKDKTDYLIVIEQ